MLFESTAHILDHAFLDKGFFCGTKFDPATTFSLRYVTMISPHRFQISTPMEHCKRIAKDLEDYCNGLVRKCPNCGELVEIDELTTGDKYRCPSCENTEYVEEYEYQNLYDYFEDALDIEYRVGSDKQLRSVCIMVTCGGPNIYIDTATKQVELYWWGDRASYPIDHDVCDEIDNYFEEIFNYQEDQT